MSRLYETLRRIEEGKPGSVLSKIDGPAPGPVQPFVVLSDRTPERATELPQAEADAAPAAPAVPDAPAVPPPQPRAKTIGRTVPLRISTGTPVFPFDGSDTRTAEQYRVLRTRLLQHELQPRVIAVTSAGAGDGKTTTAVNTAGALSLNRDGKILLIDADMRLGRVAPLLGIEPTPGLADVLAGKCDLSDAIVQLEQTPNLFVLPNGNPPANPSELLGLPGWKNLIRTARELFQFTVIDTTPVAAVADFDLVQSAADSVLLIVRPDHTRRTALTDALSIIPKAKLLGAVVNCTPDWFLWRGYDAPYYYYSTKGKNAAPRGVKPEAAPVPGSRG